MTPEGKIKKAVNRLLDKYKGIYKFMPVPGGFGPSSLDYLLCVGGRFVAIETKAPGKKMTPRQRFVRDQIERAGGIVFLIDNEICAAMNNLETLLHAARSNQCEA